MQFAFINVIACQTTRPTAIYLSLGFRNTIFS